MNLSKAVNVDAEPYEFEFVPEQCALVIIDMPRDFLEPGGNDVSQLRRTIEPSVTPSGAVAIESEQEEHEEELGGLRAAS